MNSRLVRQETLPRIGGGIDWGRERRVIARMGKRLMFSVEPHKVAAEGGGQKHQRRHTYLAEPDKDGVIDGRLIIEGIVTNNLLLANKADIDAFFGDGATREIVRRRSNRLGQQCTVSLSERTNEQEDQAIERAASVRQDSQHAGA